MRLSELFEDAVDVELVDAIDETVTELAADAERLAEAGAHQPACAGVRFDGIVDSPESCDCGWGRALAMHEAVKAGAA
jgi:hypothetical protein